MLGAAECEHGDQDAHDDAGVGEVEHRPAVKVDVVDHVPLGEAVDGVGGRTAEDEAESDLGERPRPEALPP